MRGLHPLRPLLASVLWLLTAMPAARAADAHPPVAEPAGAAGAAEQTPLDGAPAGAAGASPWEHPLWHGATTLMRLYICDYARRPPSWCADERRPPAAAALPEPQGPTLSPEDAAWQDFLKTAEPAKLRGEQLAMLRRRAVERRDPEAMEILGFLHAEGLSVPRDYIEAYRWYGLAFLAGETGVRENMDIVWQRVQQHDLEGAQALKREFDSLAAGGIPASLAPAPAPTAAPAASAAVSAEPPAAKP